MAQPQSDRRSDRIVSIERTAPSPRAESEEFERVIATMPEGDELVIDIYADRVHLHGHQNPARGGFGAPLLVQPGSCSMVVLTNG